MNKYLVCAALCSAGIARAAVFDFDLEGQITIGLADVNELHSVIGGPFFARETGSGISYDNESNLLSIDIEWGLLDPLSGTPTAGHIHGPANFNQTAGVLHTLSSLPGWNPSPSGGGFSGTVTLSEPQEAMLMNGLLYINIHTAQNPLGEIRGNLINVTPVPEPGETCAVIAGALGVFALARRIRGRMA